MIYVDFDGTIVDIWKRYHRVFMDASGTSRIPLGEYIRVKQKEQSDARVAEYFSFKLPPMYWEKKRELLESPEYLRMDTLLLSAEELLSFFSSHSCRILTARRNPRNLYKQLEWLGLSELKAKSIILDPDGAIQKRDYILQYNDGKVDWMIGDSRAEAAAAEIPGTQVVLVKTGLQLAELLNTSGNCEIIGSLSEFIKQHKEFD